MKKVILTSIIGLSFAVSANAATVGWNNQYITAGVSGGFGTGSAGMVMPAGAGVFPIDGFRTITDVDEKLFGLNVGYGAHLQDNVRAELNFEYRGVETTVDVFDGLLNVEKDIDSLFLAIANLFVDFDFGYKIVPYAGFGVGAGYLFADANKGLFEEDLDISNFAYSTSFMLGLSYKITDSWTAGLEYKYTAVYGDFEGELEELIMKYEKPVLHEFKLSARYYF